MTDRERLLAEGKALLRIAAEIGDTVSADAMTGLKSIEIMLDMLPAVDLYYAIQEQLALDEANARLRRG